MAKRGRSATFHGAFKSKARAIKKERSVHGFIIKRKIRGSLRYIVVTKKGR